MNDYRHDQPKKEQELRYKLKFKYDHIEVETSGDKAFVLGKFEELKTIVWELMKRDGQVKVTRKIADDDDDEPVKQVTNNDSSSHLKITDGKESVSSTDQVLMVIYQLQSVSKGEKVPSSWVKKQCIEKFKQPVNNISVALQNNVKKGMLERSGENPILYQITDKGTKYVEKEIKK